MNSSWARVRFGGVVLTAMMASATSADEAAVSKSGGSRCRAPGIAKSDAGCRSFSLGTCGGSADLSRPFNFGESSRVEGERRNQTSKRQLIIDRSRRPPCSTRQADAAHAVAFETKCDQPLGLDEVEDRPMFPVLVLASIAPPLAQSIFRRLFSTINHEESQLGLSAIPVLARVALGRR